MSKYIIGILISIVLWLSFNNLYTDSKEYKYNMQLENTKFTKEILLDNNKQLTHLNLNVKYTASGCAELNIYYIFNNKKIFMKQDRWNSGYKITTSHIYNGDYYGNPLIIEYIPSLNCEDNKGSLEFTVNYEAIFNVATVNESPL